MILQAMQHKHHIRRQGREPMLKSGGGVQMANDALELLTQPVSAASQHELKHSCFGCCCATGNWPEPACEVAFGSSMAEVCFVRRLWREGVGDGCLAAFWRSHRSLTALFDSRCPEASSSRDLAGQLGGLPGETASPVQDQLWARKRCRKAWWWARH